MPEALTIIFDLDGTLTNPREGIAKSINFALRGLGKPHRAEKDLIKYIGPTLKTAFSDLMDTHDDAVLLKAINLFRQRYYSVGFMENSLYDGINTLLSHLKDAGHNLFVATLKRGALARRVGEYFGIAEYFNGIFGCDLDIPKVDVLENILGITGVQKKAAFMVGDRETDMTAGTNVGIRTVGVSWGFGSRSELSSAEVVVDSPTDLLRYFRNAQKQNC